MRRCQIWCHACRCGNCPKPSHRQSQTIISPRPVSGCPLLFACHANSTRSTSETSRKRSRSNSPLVWSPPLSRLRIQTPLAKPRWCVNARSMRFAAVTQFKGATKA